ncbi:hypothetical protein [Pseudomarimonas salicorniae]|uniref:Uncharacterized protein n=1 Tax=Pseudomarimonas salicorniae TaxID=2933270 RepID=A0ABT0GGV5_9GAMM|nr:hypothetical protein [Lysobacter sp. CAU 1642]MCK7593683.1 hypothetical protein [Lysobacter sp. CAU 1642]
MVVVRQPLADIELLRAPLADAALTAGVLAGRKVDLNPAAQAEAAAGLLGAPAFEVPRKPRLGDIVTEALVDPAPDLEGALPVRRVQRRPVSFAMGQEHGVAALGGEVHPCVGERPVPPDPLSIPVAIRDECLGRLVRVVGGPLQPGLHGAVIALFQRQQRLAAPAQARLGAQDALLLEQLLLQRGHP